MSNEVDLRKQRKVSAEVTIDTAGLATEAKQDSQISLATTLNSYVDQLESILNDIKTNTNGLNLEATQQTIGALLLAIQSNIDVTLSSRASENTLIDVKNAVLEVRDYVNELTIGSNETHNTVSASTSSVLLINTNTSRKEVIVYNSSNKQMSICPFNPAIYGTGYIVPAKTGWIIDKTDRALYGIWDTGATGNAIIQEIYE